MSKILTEQKYEDSLSLIGKIPEEWVERQEYILCELIIDNTGIMHRPYESLTKVSLNEEVV